MIKNKLTHEDQALFETMSTQYKTPNEQAFFQKLRYKQENELTVAHDLIMHENNNNDGIYIVRCEFEEYIIGQKNNNTETHVMCLSDALSLNLKKAGLLNQNITLLDWLRKLDYKGIEYDHNYDDI